MKKIILPVIILLSSLTVSPQTDIIKKVNIEINKEKPDYDEARLLIRKALADTSTNHDAKTWFTAAEIGYKEYTNLLLDATLGQMVDQERKGEAIIESYNYLLVADSIALIPVIDKKGKTTTDTKTHNKITKIMQEYYTNQDLVRYGVYLNEHQNYKQAYIAFKMHTDIPNLEMMNDPKIQSTMPKDSTYYQYLYYATLFAIQSEFHKPAINNLNLLIKNNSADEKTYQFLYQEYINVNDSASALKTLIKANKKYPKDAWFTQNIINIYILQNKQSEALNFLNKTIKQNPDSAIYHYIKGNILEQMDSATQANKEFDTAIKLNPNHAAAYAGKARIIYNKAVQQQNNANNVSDKEYEMWKKEFENTFKKAIPLFQKAHQLDKSNPEYIKTLLYLYQRFNMTNEYNQLKTESNL